MLALVAYSLKPVKLWRNKSHHFYCSVTNNTNNNFLLCLEVTVGFLLLYILKYCITNNVAPVCMEPQQCWPRENVCACALQSFFRITVPECIAPLDNRQKCWQFLRPFAWALKSVINRELKKRGRERQRES